MPVQTRSQIKRSNIVNHNNNVYPKPPVARPESPALNITMPTIPPTQPLSTDKIVSLIEKRNQLVTKFKNQLNDFAGKLTINDKVIQVINIFSEIDKNYELIREISKSNINVNDNWSKFIDMVFVKSYTLLEDVEKNKTKIDEINYMTIRRILMRTRELIKPLSQYSNT